MKKINRLTIENAILEFEEKRGLSIEYCIDGQIVDLKHFDLAQFIWDFIAEKDR